MPIIKKEARDPNRADFYIYLNVHHDTGERVPFYVGKGSNGRSDSVHGRNPFWHRVATKHGYTTEIMESGMTEEAAFALEKHLIKTIGRRDLGLGPLVNLTDGGEGMSGHVLSDETKAKMSATTTGRKLSDHHRQRISQGKKGMKFTDAHRKKLSDAKMGKPSKLKGKPGTPRTEEEKANLSAKLTGITRSAETRAKMSAAKKAHFARLKSQAPVVEDAPVAQKTRRPRTAEEKAAISAKLSGRKLSDETRAKMSAAAKQRAASSAADATDAAST